MGLFGFWQRRKERARAEEAARQIYAHLLAGKKLEVPAYLSKDSPTAQAILVLREKYPDVTCTMLQSKSLVLARVNVSKAAMSSEGWRVLDAHGYFPEGRLPAEAFFQAHEGFMRQNDIDPDAVSREHEAARREETAVRPVSDLKYAAELEGDIAPLASRPTGAPLDEAHRFAVESAPIAPTELIVAEPAVIEVDAAVAPAPDASDGGGS